MLIPVNTIGIKSGKFVEKLIPENGHFINSCSYVCKRHILTFFSYYLLPPLDEKSTTQSGKVSYMARKDGNTDKIQSKVINGNISHDIPRSSRTQLTVVMRVGN